MRPLLLACSLPAMALLSRASQVCGPTTAAAVAAARLGTACVAEETGTEGVGARPVLRAKSSESQSWPAAYQSVRV